MFNLKNKFEKKMDNYYSSKLIEVIKDIIISSYNLDVKFEERNNIAFIIEIKKRKYNDKQWAEVFRFFKKDSLAYFFNQKELSKEIISIVESYCNNR